MNVAMSVVEHEKAAALRWMEWVKELGTTGHRLFLLCTAGWDASEVIAAAQLAFPGATSVIQDAEGDKSDWQQHEAARSASGPNSSFRQVAWHMAVNKLGPWFWCETDAIPLKKGWLESLETEYQRGGKPFMGAKVEINGIPPHLSGNAIYPQDTPSYAPSIVMRTDWIPSGSNTRYELAFDIAGAQEVLPKAHFTNLIQHIFRHPGFKSREEFDKVIDPDAVIFHSNKSGDIYPYLRENLSGEAKHQPHKNEVLHPVDHAGANVDGSVSPTQNNFSEQLPETARTGNATSDSAFSDVATSSTASGLTFKQHVEALRDYAKSDGLAKGRVVFQLQKAGLIPPKKKKRK